MRSAAARLSHAKSLVTPARMAASHVLGVIRDLPAAAHRTYRGSRSFLADLEYYRDLDEGATIVHRPMLEDKTPTTYFDYHYVYQGPWVFDKLYRTRPAHHVDIASFIGYLGFFSVIVPTTFVDIRPTHATFPNFSERAGSVLDLPFRDGELASLSCLHVIEHIGLGRYGDPIDPDGLARAVLEMKRVIAPGGNLYLTTTVGKRTTYFNAHRVSDPQDILDLMEGFNLRELSGIIDGGDWVDDITVEALRNNAYACGMYWFTRREYSGR